MREMDPKNFCKYCFNCRVYRPQSEEEYYFNTLCDENDFSSCGVDGNSVSDERRIMITSGYGKPVRIEVDEWSEQCQRWITTLQYFPKFCPECGRRLDEYEKTQNDNN